MWPASSHRLGVETLFRPVCLRSLIVIAFAVSATGAGAQQTAFNWSTATPLYPGILHADLRLSSPDRLEINCLRIDTLTPGLSFSTTPRASAWQSGVRETIRQTTPGFVTASQTTDFPVVAAVNANLYTVNGSAADLTGFAVSEGVLVSPGVADGVGKASFSLTHDGVPSIGDTIGATAAGSAWTAVSGIYQCLADGSPRLSGTDRQPRTGIGVSEDTRYVYFMTIDGRSTASVGATNYEVGEWLASFGAWDGIYMDGGGSTTMAWWNPAASGSNKTQVLNTPSDGSPRAVGNNIGVTFTTPVYTTGELWWAGDGVRGGSGTWSPAAVTWRDGAIYGPDVAWNSEPAIGTTAVFAGPAGTVVPASGVTAERLDFRTTGYRLGSNATASDLTLVGAPQLIAPGGGTVLVTTKLAGVAPRLIGGDGAAAALIGLRPLGGDSTLTGTAHVTGNLTVELGHVKALGTAAVQVDAGSGLDLRVDGGSFANPLSLAGSGSTGLGGAVRFFNSAAITGPVTLAADTTIKAGGLFSVTATLAGGISGSGGLTVTGLGSSRLVLASPATHTGGTRITGGTLALVEGASLSGSVTVAAAGRLQLPATTVLTIQPTSLTIAAGSPGGLIDLGSGRIEVASGGTTLATMIQAIFAGRGDGSWQGTTGITSSVAAASGGSRTLGYLAPPGGPITVAFASAGDTNLNGQVDAFDLVTMAAGGRYATPLPATWHEGDFNYDGLVSVLDLIAIQSAGTYGSGPYLPGSAAAAFAVPEPMPAWPAAAALVAAAQGWRRRPIRAYTATEET
jgi:autotransporter-associated beta strand protein